MVPPRKSRHWNPSPDGILAIMSSFMLPSSIRQLSSGLFALPFSNISALISHQPGLYPHLRPHSPSKTRNAPFSRILELPDPSRSPARRGCISLAFRCTLRAASCPILLPPQRLLDPHLLIFRFFIVLLDLTRRLFPLTTTSTTTPQQEKPPKRHLHTSKLNRLVHASSAPRRFAFKETTSI